MRITIGIGRANGPQTSPVIDDQGREVGHVFAVHGTRWTKGGQTYHFVPNDAGAALGLERTQGPTQRILLACLREAK